ncbi:hypothetical protein N1851_003716 [Merluccius polli]|uniref:Integrase core domain-containing protein n=1 Tax=Merluccius polli TaxID=89951 RepID=A0AA47N9A8_MERPO|nr:hypothetical protein N1851_003716 [Merluccius polli]
MSVTSIFYSVLHSLEDEGQLDPNNSTRLFCCHYVFLPHLQHSLNVFRDGWDNHPLRTEQNMTPNQMWAMGELQNPIHDPDDVEPLLPTPACLTTRLFQPLLPTPACPTTSPVADPCLSDYQPVADPCLSDYQPRCRPLPAKEALFCHRLIVWQDLVFSPEGRTKREKRNRRTRVD